MREIAHQAAGAHCLPIVEYLIGAAAQEIGAGAVHYDGDHDKLAEAMEFDSIWLAPAGTIR